MSIVKDRLSLLNKEDADNIVFTDLSSEGVNGTRVEVVLPVFYY